MRPDLSVPPRPQPGDRVAVVSPSFAAPGAFPAVHEVAMRRLHEEIGLVPVEYPTTRRVGASPRERAEDLMAAFADPGIRAVLATIGGDDQLTVLPHLDPDVVRADPKPFAGFSDNTNVLNWLEPRDCRAARRVDDGAPRPGGGTAPRVGRLTACRAADRW